MAGEQVGGRCTLAKDGRDREKTKMGQFIQGLNNLDVILVKGTSIRKEGFVDIFGKVFQGDGSVGLTMRGMSKQKSLKND